MGRKKHTKKNLTPPLEDHFWPPKVLPGTPPRVLFAWVLPGIIFLMATYLATVNLDWAAMWDDEAASAVFSKQIALNGEVSAWDGRNLAAFYRDGWFLDQDLIPRHSKMHYYINAVAYKLWGVSDWSGRFIQALVGLAALAVFALIVRLDFPQRADIQVISLSLLALSPVFLLAIRQSHYYSVSLFFNLLLFCCYRAHQRTKNPLWFIAMTGTAVAAFYSQFLLGTAFALSLGVWHLIFFRNHYSRRDSLYASCAAGIFVIFVGVYFVATGYWSGNLIVEYKSSLLLRIAKNLLLNTRAINENDFAPWPVWIWVVVGLVLPLLRVAIQKGSGKRDLSTTNALTESQHMIFRYAVFVLLFIVIVSIGSPQPSSYAVWGEVRYLTSVLPFSVVICAGLVMAFRRLHVVVAAAVFIAMLFSNAMAYPFLRHIYDGRTPHLTLPAVVAEVHSDYRTAYAEVAKFLQHNASPNESVIAFPLFNNWPLLFYLGEQLRFCCHISKKSPIRKQTEVLNPQALREQNFPTWLVFFSTAKIKSQIEYFSRPNRCRHVYELAKDLQVFAASTQRPEPVWHHYTPVTRFSPASSVYVFKLKYKKGDCR